MRFAGPQILGNIPPVTRSAGLGILPLESFGVEAGPVGVEMPALGRMAGEAVPLRVTGDAALDVLPRCRAMPDEKGGIRVVVALGQPATGREPRLLVTGSAEGALVMAGGAIGLPVEGRGGMPAQESCRMVVAGGPCVRTVAFQALGACVAGVTGAGRGTRDRGVPVREVGSMVAWLLPFDARAYRPDRVHCSGRASTIAGRLRWQTTQLSWV